MTIIDFAQLELNKDLTYCQMDLLEILEKDYEWGQRTITKFHDGRVAFDIYQKWKEHCDRLVAV